MIAPRLDRMWTWIHQGFVPCEAVPLSDRGFRYGMSVFESIRIANGVAQYLPEHLALLGKACVDRRFHCDETIFGAVGELLVNCGMDGLARIYVTAGDGTATSPADEARVFVYVEARERPAQGTYQIGMGDEMCFPLFGGLKTANYWMSLDLLWRAQGRGLDEVLLFNGRAELVSACMANVFVVHGGTVRTPSTQCGARAGVIRGTVLERLEVQEASLFVGDVMSADEIFLTNSWIGIVPVSSVSGHVLPSRRISAQLAQV